MKNVLIVLLSCAALLSFVGCNQSKQYSDRWFYVSTDLDSDRNSRELKASRRPLPNTA